MKETLPILFVIMVLTGAITYSLAKKTAERLEPPSCVAKTKVESLETCNNYYCWYTVFGGRLVKIRMDSEPYSNGDYICDELITKNEN